MFGKNCREVVEKVANWPKKPTMDPLVSAAVGLQQARLASQVQYAVARKILDSQTQQASATVKLIEAAGKGVTQAGDELVAAATGLGGLIDTVA